MVSLTFLNGIIMHTLLFNILHQPPTNLIYITNSIPYQGLQIFKLLDSKCDRLCQSHALAHVCVFIFLLQFFKMQKPFLALIGLRSVLAREKQL